MNKIINSILELLKIRKSYYCYFCKQKMIMSIYGELKECNYYYCPNHCQSFYTFNNKTEEHYINVKNLELYYYTDETGDYLYVSDRNNYHDNEIRIPYFNFWKMSEDELYRKIKTYLIFI